MGRLQGPCNRLRLIENIMITITITITRFLNVIDYDYIVRCSGKGNRQQNTLVFYITLYYYNTPTSQWFTISPDMGVFPQTTHYRFKLKLKRHTTRPSPSIARSKLPHPIPRARSHVTKTRQSHMTTTEVP